ncbi:MAG TPA: VWA domain-containing protein, partial [Bryobacteraceae bacterium]|nr:VWA domain-containing protein [Bryobacteraceae bacterium]
MTKTLFIAVATFAFLLSAAPEQQAAAPAPEVSTQEDVPVFQSKITLIEVPVIVRDKKGKAVGSLREEDFQLFDKGKGQVISGFSVEKLGGGKTIASVSTPGEERAPGEKGAGPSIVAADHFVGLLFDDLHTNFADMVAIRTAAQKFVASSLKSTDRAAIFTTSGQIALDFTDDRELLSKTILKLAPYRLGRASTERCPSISLYQADRMVNFHDALAIGVAVGDYEKCFPQTPYDVALQSVMARAREVFFEGRQETAATIVDIRTVVRRMAEMPGQRTLILASPGFILLQDQYQDEGLAIDLAIRSGVIINSLDVKGVRPPVTFSAENRETGAQNERLYRQADIATSGTLDDLASGTGGRTFHDNFLETGLKELGAAPEVFYLLGFSPQNLKRDGTFHSL